MSAQIVVRGNATADEVAAVLAVVARLDRGMPPDAYRRWRDIRQSALRHVRGRSAGRPAPGEGQSCGDRGG